MIVSKRISFDAAHYLPGYPGKCKNVHGHHWVIEVSVEGPIEVKSGMVVDFTHLGLFLKLVEGLLDHTLVNDTIENPTAENIAEWVRRLFLEHQPSNKDLSEVVLVEVKVWETEDSCAILPC